MNLPRTIRVMPVSHGREERPDGIEFYAKGCAYTVIRPAAVAGFTVIKIGEHYIRVSDASLREACSCSFCYDLRALQARVEEVQAEPKNDSRRTDLLHIVAIIEEHIKVGNKCYKA